MQILQVDLIAIPPKDSKSSGCIHELLISDNYNENMLSQWRPTPPPNSKVQVISL